mgnify:CR=1 FL=1
MLTVFSSDIDVYPGSQEERLPGFSAQFPHITSRALLPDDPARSCIWHWHKSLELFQVESGALRYHTPGGQRLFRAGSGGMVNSNVLHRTQALEPGTVMRIHLFEPELLSGIPGGLLEQKYILPLVQQPGLELICFSPGDSAQRETLALLQQSFALDEDAFGYELRLQSLLAEIWLHILNQLPPLQPALPCRAAASSEKVKQMMLYLNTHLAEKLSVADIAAAGYCSERECYRTFQECLHTTPAEYLQNLRLQNACRLLIRTGLPVTDIAQQCGLGSSSYFGAQFRRAFGCTPTAYREKWQDVDTARHKSDSTGSLSCGTINP